VWDQWAFTASALLMTLVLCKLLVTTLLTQGCILLIKCVSAIHVEINIILIKPHVKRQWVGLIYVVKYV